jgi:polysaccharide deacetylase family protein (PEP-CTERM system associated)
MLQEANPIQAHGAMKNALTIDVEDYYMVSAFADRIKFSDWPCYESRVERNTLNLLQVLDSYRVKATFFVLGWVAEQCPRLVKEIHGAGHEVACHGYNHRLVYELSRDQFRDDLRRAKHILEDITGAAITGYRATSYSIVPETLWALDILVDEGFVYDSSIYPIHHDRYGFPGAERFLHTIRTSGGEIVEFPPSTYSLLGQNIPVAGGGYLRLYPVQITKAAIRGINTREKKAAVIYLHPWEIDVDQPRISACWKSKMRHYVNLSSTLPKLRHLLEAFKFGTMAMVVAGNRGATAEENRFNETRS